MRSTARSWAGSVPINVAGHCTVTSPALFVTDTVVLCKHIIVVKLHCQLISIQDLAHTYLYPGQKWHWSTDILISYGTGLLPGINLVITEVCDSLSGLCWISKFRYSSEINPQKFDEGLILRCGTPECRLCQQLVFVCSGNLWLCACAQSMFYQRTQTDSAESQQHVKPNETIAVRTQATVLSCWASIDMHIKRKIAVRKAMPYLHQIIRILSIPFVLQGYGKLM